MSSDEFGQLDPLQIQLIFSQKHILVHGLPTDGMSFDERGMATLTQPSKTFTVQGMSI
jgi:hypothetical protein